MLSLFRPRPDPAAALRAVLGEHDLPSFPAVVLRVLERLRDPDAPTAELARLVELDPGLSVRVLRTVNSASFAMRHEVRNVRHALSLLGRGPLESLLISLGVHAVLPATAVVGYDARRFWFTSVRRAVTARSLAERVDPTTCSESFTAALLQDMALPLLSHRGPAGYGPLLERWHRGPDELQVLEREEFAWDHAEVATWMCRGWEFPATLTGAIGSHHGTADEALSPLPAVQLVAVLREGHDRAGDERLVEDALERFALPRDETAELLEQSLTATRGLAGLFH